MTFSLLLKVDHACILILSGMEIHRSRLPHVKVRSPRVEDLSHLRTERLREEDAFSIDCLRVVGRFKKSCKALWTGLADDDAVAPLEDNSF